MAPTTRQTPPTVRSNIYQVLYDAQEFCSKQMLAAKCGISMPTLYQNLGELMEEGLVQYSGEEKSTGGRRAQGLDIVPDARLAVGIAISEHRLRLVLADLRLHELAYRAIPFDFVASLSEENAALAGILETFLDDYHVDRERLLGIGITIPALITPDRSRIHVAPTLNLRDVPLEQLTKNIPYPVYVENDASASGFAECFVRGKSESLAYFSLEYGIGGAVLMGGVPYSGDNSQSGEFGHMCLEPGGLLCSCGKHGCMEAYCSVRRIENTFGVSLEEDLHALTAQMVAMAARPDVDCVVIAVDCDVLLGGLLSEYLQPWLPTLRQYVLAGNPFRNSADFVQLSTLRRHITPLGAALYFIQEFVNNI